MSLDALKGGSQHVIVRGPADKDPAADDRLDRLMEEVLTKDRNRELLERWPSR